MTDHVPQADGHSFLVTCLASSLPGFSSPGDNSGRSGPTPVHSMGQKFVTTFDAHQSETDLSQSSFITWIAAGMVLALRLLFPPALSPPAVSAFTGTGAWQGGAGHIRETERAFQRHLGLCWMGKRGECISD